MNTVVGNINGQDLRIGLVCARFNQVVTKALAEGARDALVRHGVPDAGIDEFWVPGALELGIAAKAAATTGNYHGLVLVGAVVRGDTAHFDVVVSESASQCSRIGYEFDIPVANAILTTDTMDQAFDRAGGKSGNKGAEAAVTVLEMVDVLAKIRKGNDGAMGFRL
jgi:6,7-dimethyl-8-ribityllumazine synthase